MLPPIPISKFPTTGYTYCTWFRIESFEDQVHADESLGPYAPRLCRFKQQGTRKSFVEIDFFLFFPFPFFFFFSSNSLTTSDGRGIEIYFALNYLSIQSKSSKKFERQTFRHKFEEKKWYFVCVVHEYRLFRTSQATLYVNGEQVESEPLFYPKIEEDLTCCHVGTCWYPQSKRTQPFYGQQGPLFFLNTAIISPPIIKKMFELGPKSHQLTRPTE
jgi:hypothetical protein